MTGRGEPDRGFGIKEKPGAREGDAVRNAGAGFMQTRNPLAGQENARQGPFSSPEDREGEQTAESAGGKRVIAQMIETKPDRNRSPSLG